MLNIFTVGNMAGMICLGQGGLRSLSASSSYMYFEIFICIYSVMGEIDQISTNTSKYSTCCAAMFTSLITYLLEPL